MSSSFPTDAQSCRNSQPTTTKATNQRDHATTKSKYIPTNPPKELRNSTDLSLASMEKKPDQTAADPLIPPPPPPPLPPHFTFFTDLRLQLSSCRCICSSLLSAAASLSFLFLLWPSDPHLRVDRISIDRVRVSFHPSVSVSVDLRLRISIRNPDFFSLDYDALDIAVAYRGQRLGSVMSSGGRVMARGVSYVDAELRIDGIEVLHDIFYLIEDLARRSIPFETVAEIRGLLHFLFIDVPIKGRLSCLVNVNPANHTVIRHDCHIE